MAITKAIAFHGMESFVCEILHEGIDCHEELNRLERVCIEEHRSNEKAFGYNLSLGGEGNTMEPEARRQVTERLLANHPLRGKHPSPETLLRLSAATTGEKNPMFGKRGPLAPGFGRKCPDWVKKKLSAMKKGVPRTASEVENIRKASQRPESRANLSAALKRSYAAHPERHILHSLRAREGNRKRAESGIPYPCKDIPDFDSAVNRVISGEPFTAVAKSINIHCNTLRNAMKRAGVWHVGLTRGRHGNSADLHRLALWRNGGPHGFRGLLARWYAVQQKHPIRKNEERHLLPLGYASWLDYYARNKAAIWDAIQPRTSEVCTGTADVGGDARPLMETLSRNPLDQHSR